MTGLSEILKLDHDDVVWIANQNQHKTYTLRINKIFKFYPTWYLLPSSYIYLLYCDVFCWLVDLGFNVPPTA